MITPEQEKWLAHLSTKDQVRILPFDSESNRKFETVKKRVLALLDDGYRVQHCGASSMGISGQGELDIYVPVAPTEFDAVINVLKEEFGEPGSLYSLKRARFNSEIEGTKVELFVINREDAGWLESQKFEAHLRTHPLCLKEYEALKEAGDGLSTQEYYRRKTEFINETLREADK